jgi:hypothetical protein
MERSVYNLSSVIWREGLIYLRRKSMLFRKEVFNVTELHFNMFKIKYSKLEELLEDFTFTKGEEVYIYINLESILKKLSSTIADKQNIINPKKRNIVLTSCVFNLISHYRYYFHKKSVCSRIFVYGPEAIDANYLNREYNKDYRMKSVIMNTEETSSIAKTYEDSVKMIKTILNYIEGVNFITSGIIEPSVIPLVISKHFRTEINKNFLITDDRYDYQYIKEYFIILKPRMDKSLLIDSLNVMDVLKSRTKCNNIPNPDINFLPFIISILGDKYRNIDKIKGLGVSRIYNKINEGLKSNIITNDINNINSLACLVNEEFQNDFLINYMTTSIFEQYKKMSDVEEKYILNQIIDKHDGGYLKVINEDYFNEYPLNIIEINTGIKKRKLKINWR